MNECEGTTQMCSLTGRETEKDLSFQKVTALHRNSRVKEQEMQGQTSLKSSEGTMMTTSVDPCHWDKEERGFQKNTGTNSATVIF